MKEINPAILNLKKAKSLCFYSFDEMEIEKVQNLKKNLLIYKIEQDNGSQITEYFKKMIEEQKLTLSLFLH